MNNTTVCIIGGGYIGAATAIHLVRCSQKPLNICIIETSPTIGRGVAFSALDKDHRLNGPTGIHFLYPEKIESFTEWHETSGAKEKDPESIADDGRVYARRADFGAYVAKEFLAHQQRNPSGSTISHYQDKAINLVKSDLGWCIELLSGIKIQTNIVIVTPCNFSPAIPAPLRKVAMHSAVFTNPWNLGQLAEITPHAKVLIIGTGLTMADVAITVLRDRPKCRITAISRHGLLPQDQRSHPPAEPLWESLTRPIPEFVERYNLPKTVPKILRALRSDVARLGALGIEWHVAFDQLRDAACHLWPSLPLEEQRRYFRHLSSWYVTHRFRLAPQVLGKLSGYQRVGRLKYRAGFMTDVVVNGCSIQVGLRPRGKGTNIKETYDAIINCTGPGRDLEQVNNPFLACLINYGFATVSPFGLGFEVDTACRAITNDGDAANNLFILGPLTQNKFGEINGIPAITHQIHRITGEIAGAAIHSIGPDRKK